MTKLIGVFITGVLFLTGCGNSVSNQNNEETKKKSRIEVHSAQNDTYVTTIDDQMVIKWFSFKIKSVITTGLYW